MRPISHPSLFSLFVCLIVWSALSANTTTDFSPATTIDGVAHHISGYETGDSSAPPPIVTPIIRAFIPLSDTAGGTVTIYGQHFTGVNNVTFGNTSAASFKILSDSSITAVVGAGTTGLVSVGNIEYAVYAESFTFISDPNDFMITSISPDSAAVGNVVTIRGKHLSKINSIVFDGTSGTTYSLQSDSIILVTLGSFVGTRSLYLTITSISNTFSYPFYIYGSIPKPSISSFSPTSAHSGDTVNIFGYSFTNINAVSFGGVNSRSFRVLNDSIITAVVGNGATGAVEIRRDQDATSRGTFTYLGNGSPLIVDSLSPSSGYPGATPYIIGRNLSTVTSVNMIGLSGTSYTVLSDTVIKLSLGTPGVSGTFYGYVANATDTVQISFKFLPVPPSPYLISFNPTSDTSGGIVTLHGANLTSATSISFGSTPAASFTILSDSIIEARVGAGSSGYVYITGAVYKDSLPGFTYLTKTDTLPGRIEITSFTPHTAGNGETVTIAGRHLQAVSSVTFGGVPCSSFVINGDTALTATVGAGASGYVKLASSIAADSLDGFLFKDSADTIEPYKLLQFSGTISGTQVLLQWSAQHEQSILNYDILRSLDSLSFFLIHVESSQHTDDVNNYLFSDSLQQSQIIYYRLKITDTAGNVSYSPTISIANPVPNGVYPNPASGFITVNYPQSISASEIFIVDISGRVVISAQEPAATTQATIDISHLRPGIYKVRWADWRSRFVKTILVKQ